MPVVELSTSAYDGHVVVVLRGDLDITGTADAGAAITALVVPDRWSCGGQVAAYADSASTPPLTTVNIRRRVASIPSVLP
jgi:hypothetical protein